MICKKCAAENPVNAPFCSLCFTPLIEPSARTEMWKSASAEEAQAEPAGESVAAAPPNLPTFAFTTRLYGIVGAENMTVEQLKNELDKGGKIVRFRYCVGLLLNTIRRESPPYLVRAGKSVVTPGLKYSLLSFLLGWWGIPMGPFYTPSVIYSNFLGNNDITYEYVGRMESESRRAFARNYNPYESVEPYDIPDFHSTPV